MIVDGSVIIKNVYYYQRYKYKFKNSILKNKRSENKKSNKISFLFSTMSLLFSPPISSYTLLSPHHQACTIAQQLIATGFVQFQLQQFDNSDPYHKIYSRVKSLKQKVLKMLATIENNFNQKLQELSQQQKIQTIGKMKDYMDQLQIDHLKYLDRKQHQIEQKLHKLNQLTSLNDNFQKQLQKNLQEIQVSQIKLQTVSNKNVMVDNEFVLLTGSMMNKDRFMIEKIMFRKTRGHSFMVARQSQKFSDRSVFVYFISQGIYRHIGQKLESIFLLNKVNLYNLPNNEKQIFTRQQYLQNQIQELQKLLVISGQQLAETLRQQFTNRSDNLRHQLFRLSYLQRLLYIVCHSKKIGNNNNYSSNYVMFTIHIPSDMALPIMNASQIPLQQSEKSIKKRTILPRLPCLAQVNILTQLYSIPKHNQLLPQIFMFSTVPILFGMMFSDFGHGTMLLIACFLLKLGPIFYLMAFMSIYCGVIYNQFFGMKIIRSQDMGILHGQWGASQNGLNFENSLKMKISMVVAFVHMTFGMVLKIINELKRSQKSIIFYDSLPKLGLLFTTVGYLVLLIIKKWLKNFQGEESTAPSIINSMLQLYLGWNESRRHSIFKSVEVQKQIGGLMIKLSLGFILVMVYNHTIRNKVQDVWTSLRSGRRHKMYKRIQNSRSSYAQFQDQDEETQRQQIRQISEELVREGKKKIQSEDQKQREYYRQADHHESELGALQVFEYILSLISSTTSYLRLFALSLAHAKLSHLLLTFLLGGLSSHQPSLSMAKCFVFFVVSIGMMMVLDVMQCMMHVVRLHWVEWMGKFYQGGGKVWKPQRVQDLD